MISEKELDLLIKWSERDKNFNLVLKKDAPENIIEIAKQFYWKPFDIVNGVKYIV